MATRPAFNEGLEVRQPFLSLLYHKIPGEAAWTLVDQGRVINPEATADTREYKRIGDKKVKKVSGAISHSVGLTVYVGDDLQELGRLYGFVRPPGGWVGTEVIQLDPAFEADLKIENYDGSDVGAALLFTEYLNQFVGSRVALNLDGEGDVRMAEFTGSCDDYYIIPEAGV